MSERKVLTKYYPPDFDPSALGRVRAPKKAGPKVQTVRLMAPFSMKCTTCGEYIYKGRKFNARKETPEGDKYLGIQIFRFYIRCTRCSAEITFRTDPKNQDYQCERGAKRNTEPWRVVTEDETDEQRLDRLEAEEKEQEGEEERNAMADLEAKTVDAKREMAVADALDEIRTRNARLERADRDGAEVTVAAPVDDEAARQEREDAEAARRAFEFARRAEAMEVEIIDDDGRSFAAAPAAGPSRSASASKPAADSGTSSTVDNASTSTSSAPASTTSTDMPPPTFKRVVKKKKDHSALLGIKKKPSLV
ncbi:CWC16 protein [Microdochium trichocladiopsis]|uniref:Splicing factor YJU2 n=1 Tax=Microdochium trichocladiopsis TaxID=1682393 RepID=A0A9P8Y9S7_9PEZI|nr:CWC16 protein [Microdochium trichocladiopsis]KAH7033211.1 CWC16 protein [Microdochium trichocladiopsis]